MNVRWIRILVIRTLTVPTLTVLTAVLVNKDLLEMERLVKVGENIIPYRTILIWPLQTYHDAGS